MLNSPTVRAVLAAILFASTLGVLVAVGGFGVVRIISQMGEGLSLLPNRWGEENIGMMMILAGVIALPVAVWFVFWFYRRAIAAETALQTYKYVPPNQPSGAKS